MLQSVGSQRVGHDSAAEHGSPSSMEWKSKSKVLARLCSGESLLQGSRRPVSCCVLTWCKGSLRVSFLNFVYLFIYIFWSHCTACGILVPRPGIGHSESLFLIPNSFKFINRHLKYETIKIIDKNIENLHDLGFGLWIMDFEF